MENVTSVDRDVVGEANVLRQRMLNASLLVAVIVGGLGFVRVFIDAIGLEAWRVAGVSVFLYVSVVALLLARRLPYRVRTLGFLTLLFLAGVFSLLAVGYLAAPVLVLVSQNVLVSVFFDRRATWIALGVNLMAILAAGTLLSSGILSVETTTFYDPTDFVDWLRVTVLFALFCGIAVVSVNVLTSHLDESLQDQAELVENLKGAIQLRDDADRQRREAESRLRHNQKIEALGHLAGGVAHDFNNTLTVVSTRAELLRTKNLTPLEVKEIARQIEHAAHGAAEMIHQLLTFARKTPLQPEYVSANEIASSTALLGVTPLPSNAVVAVNAFAQSSGGFALMHTQINQGTTVGIYLPAVEDGGLTHSIAQ